MTDQVLQGDMRVELRTLPEGSVGFDNSQIWRYNQSIMKETKCKECGAIIIRAGSRSGVFCSIRCKAEWQRRQKPVDRDWLYQKYVEEGLSTYQIGKIVNRNPKNVYRWLKDLAIPTRRRGWNIPYGPGGKSKPTKPYHEREWLYHEYVERDRSARDIADEFGVTTNNILYFLHKLKIPTRSLKKARSLFEVRLVGEANAMFGKTGPLNPNWQGGCTPERQAFYSTPEWKEAQGAVWQRDNATCRRCDVRADGPQDQRPTMHIHHIVSFQKEDHRLILSNLMLVCASCHYWIHGAENTNRDFIREGGDEE